MKSNILSLVFRLFPACGPRPESKDVVLQVGWDGMGWNGMGWDGMGWDGMGWNGMG